MMHIIEEFESLKGKYEPGYTVEDMRDRAIYHWYATRLDKASKEEVLAVAQYATAAGYSAEALLVGKSWSATPYYEQRKAIWEKYHVEPVVGYPKSDIGGLVGISREAVYQRIRAGHPLPEPGVRIGAKTGWTVEQVRRWDADFRENSGR